MIPENERIEFEGQTYVNPEASLQEQNAFINNLRNIQNQNTAEIATDTYNLGNAIPSNLGGLGGGGSYFEARNSVPQGVALANDLRAAAQAQALNDILSNEQAMMKQRYSNAQRAARQRARARARYSGGGGSGEPEQPQPITGGVEETDTTSTVVSVVPGAPNGYTVANILPDWDNMTSEVNGYTYVPYGQEGKVNYVYGGGGSSVNARNATSRNTLQPTNRLQPTNNLPNWGRL